MLGRPSNPTALKIIRGIVKRGRKHEPRPPVVTRPIPPKHISAKAKIHWAYIVDTLDCVKILTKSDMLALEGLCEIYADYRHARDVIKKEGRYYESINASGSRLIRQHPALRDVSDADRRLRLWLVEFGMTPSARSRFKGPSAAVSDEAEEKAQSYFTGRTGTDG